MPRTWPFRPVLAALSLGTAVGAAPGAGCTASDDDVLRRDVLAHLADEVFVPTHAGLRDHGETLARAARDVCASSPASTFGAADDAWRTTRADWSTAAAFAFGPVVEQNQTGPLDFWPVRPADIEAAIAAAPGTIDAAYVDTLGTTAKGLPAVEYILYGVPVFEPGTPRCAFLAALADDVAARTAALADAWPAHADALKTAGEPGSPYPGVQAALDVIVNATIENLYAMVKSKLDRPLGNLTGTDPDPTLVESYYSRNSLDDLQANLEGFAFVYLGADLDPAGEPGLGALVAARDPDLDARILAQLDLARAALTAIPPPLADALTADRGAVQTARDEIDALRRLIKLDVASLLNVTLSLSDNDGD